LKCKSCGERDIRPSHRNKLERALSYLVPLRPYRCNACDHRQFGPASPVLDKPRIISYSILTALILIIVGLSMFGGSDPVPEQIGATEEPAAPGPAAEVAEPEPTAEPLPVPVSEAGDAPEQREPVTVSPFVAEQLAKNRARQQGEPVEERARPSVTRPTRTESPTPASTAIGGRVSDLVVSRGEGGALSIDLSGKGDFAKYRDLDLGDRLVVDLEGPWTLGSRVQSRYAVDHGSVRSVRLGLHSGYLRLVFDLTEGARPSIGLENGVDGLTIRIGGP